MEEYEDATSGKLVPPTARHRGWRSLLLVGGLALAFMLALGIGVLMGSITHTTQAASVASVSDANAQAQFFQSADNNSPSQAFGPGAQSQGQCEAMTVSSISGNTIVAKTASGSSVTIHTTASTKYTKAGATVSASAIKAGTRIQVMGTHNSDGSITATSINIS